MEPLPPPWGAGVGQRLEAGIELLGTEVKSLRAGQVNMSDAYAQPDKHQLYLHNLNIAQAITQTSTDVFIAHDSGDLIGIPNRDTRRTLLAARAPRSRWWWDESNPGESVRWLHGYINNPAPELAYLLNALGHLRDAPAPVALQSTGTYTVTGFVVHAAGFEVWTANTGIADPKMHATGGQRHVVDVTYDVPARRLVVTRCPQPGYDGNCVVQVRMGADVLTQDVTSDGVVFDLAA